MTTVYPAGPLTPHGAYMLQRGRHPSISYRSPNNALLFHLYGGMAPNPHAHDAGIVLRTLKGLMPPWQTQDQQGATQDGVTFNSAVYDPIEMDLGVTAFGRTPQLCRQVIRHWIEAWDVKQQGEFGFTSESGYWYAPLRWLKTPVDDIVGAQHRQQRFGWVGRGDDAFWRTTDSVSQLSGNTTGYLTFTNSGDQPAWPDYVFYGPGTVAIANGPNSGSMITFGPLLTNQVALLRSEPRRRGVYDLTTAQVPAQQYTQWQAFIVNLVNFATNNNVPPLLRQFESLFGILPPQAEFYAMLDGRFTNSIPAKPAGQAASTSTIRASISGAGSGTKLVGYIMPRRRWPL